MELFKANRYARDFKNTAVLLKIQSYPQTLGAKVVLLFQSNSRLYQNKIKVKTTNWRGTLIMNLLSLLVEIYSISNQF